MSEQEKEMLYDLLTKKVTSGLDPDEQASLDRFEPALVEAEFHSLERTAAAINVTSLEIEEMPSQLASRIAAEYGKEAAAEESPGESVDAPVFTADDIFDRRPRRSVFSWLGWAAAALAVVALGINIYTTRFNKGPDQVAVTPAETPRILTPAEQRDELIRSAPDVVSASWAPGNMKDMKVTGDIVWSDAKQQGYMRFRNIPTNDAAKTCYQLWIFDETQDKATPIDGGIFDVAANGDVIVPINAKIRAFKPEMFAITIERHGGVVVSKREKIAALAKVETHST